MCLRVCRRVLCRFPTRKLPQIAFVFVAGLFCFLNISLLFPLDKGVEDVRLAQVRFRDIEVKTQPVHNQRSTQHGTTNPGVVRNTATFEHLNVPVDAMDGHLRAPSIGNYLRENNIALFPAFKLSKGRKNSSLVFGVPTVRRSTKEYLVDTLLSLTECMNKEERSDSLIVVFVAEPWNMTHVKSVAATLQANFADAFTDGLLEVVAPPSEFYQDLDSVEENFGDSRERVRWRTKQNLDYAFLMTYCRSRGDYYIQLEDDIITKPGYASIIKKNVMDQERGVWLVLEFSSLGFIGKVFRTTDLPMVAGFFMMFHKDKPVDWLLDHILYVKMCNPEKNTTHCAQEKKKLKKSLKPSLFQHIGYHSSLRGKIQNLREKDVHISVGHRPHVNPMATVETSLKVYEKYSLEKAYNGDTIFWSALPRAKDYVLFTFKPPLPVQSYLFKSGDLEKNTDTFGHASLDVLPVSISALNATDIRKYKKGEDNYYQIDQFNERTGVARGVVPQSFGNLSAIRLTIHNDGIAWVKLSEIFIEQKTLFTETLH